jgi:hypothetical protein
MKGLMKDKSSYKFLIPWYVAMALTTGSTVSGQPAAAPLDPAKGPTKVEIRHEDGRYQLYVGQKPFYIKGAGMQSGSLEQLAAHGANSFRTWSADGRGGGCKLLLDRAYECGLYVTLGLSVGRERLGFDYNDPASVRRQMDEVRSEVLKYKDHPAVIIWAIGNELNLRATNTAVWDAVNGISKMIHQVDPNHLTTSPLAGMNSRVIAQVKAHAPDLDILSLQVYGALAVLPQTLRESGWDGPYLVTEWGATGHWEVGKTKWGAPIEENSTVKADSYQKRFQAALSPDHPQCIGSYAFLWGQKQERTPTWYGMFLKSGEETAAVDTVQYLWTGAWPTNRSPRVDGLWLDNKQARQSVHLTAGRVYPATLQASDPDHDSLTYSWELMEESTSHKDGGDSESVPTRVPASISQPDKSEITLKAPEKPGAYRLFAYVFDGKGHAGYANIPFYVDLPSESSPAADLPPASQAQTGPAGGENSLVSHVN